MKWNELNTQEQLDQIRELSRTKAVLILKHSTRCSISSAALSRVERHWKPENETVIVPFYLDLLSYREISNAIASEFGVIHESPQALVIKDGNCVFSQTHMSINVPEILENV